MVAALEAAGIHPIREYIRRRQVNIAEKVAFRPIYELCVKADGRPGARHNEMEGPGRGKRT